MGPARTILATFTGAKKNGSERWAGRDFSITTGALHCTFEGCEATESRGAFYDEGPRMRWERLCRVWKEVWS